MNNKFFVTLLFTLLLSFSVWAEVIDLSDLEDEEVDITDVELGDFNNDDLSDFENSNEAVDAIMVVQGYEWGPAVPKVIVEFGDIVSEFDRDTFAVKTGGSDRVILDVYNCDADGNRQTQATNYIAFEFQVNTISMFGMTAGDANPFNFDMEKFLNTWATTYELELSLVENKTFKVGNIEYGNGNEFVPFIINL
eukprot:jgi/Orpsp1_1/1184651/evm.model.c7180000090406.1